MTSTINNYEYSYKNSQPGCHHRYLLSPLLLLLDRTNSSIKQNITVLDIGCGNGSLTNEIASQGYQMTGIEESASGVKTAREYYSNCQFFQGSIYSEPPKELQQAFDIVISTEVIEHLYYPRELVRYARKCLKPNGRFILTTPYHGYFKNLVLAILGKMDSHHTVLWDGGHIKFFSVTTLSDLIESEGFSNLEFHFAGRLPYLWKSMLCSCDLNH
ncbi:methyltransferase family protein [Xenococcus sp. PCC 7305]|uniref:class I SAM-dependent methyltransferase n=1 Tax=Xenococcus sp. PCC 7305 TaxID=102125 RepID=UPI0002AD042B|nr:class I SAM-dependent methyltransferase [Xenococcus sp. PCC 7305]ELS02166.1 methyltransferase family protein [Xenococcus sp. PCC 7305]